MVLKDVLLFQTKGALDVRDIWYYTSFVNKVNDRVDDCELCAGKTGSCLLDEVPKKYAVQLSHPAVTYRRNISPLCDKFCHERSFFMKKMKTQTLVLSALLMAMHIVLSMFSITLPMMKINLSGLPIIVGGLLFGPWVGGMVGLLGSLLYQILQYGLMSTTVLWIIPHAVRGLIVGGYAKKKKFKLKKGEILGVVIVSSVVATLLNTVGMYIDGLVWGYEAGAFAAIPVRLLNSVITSILYVLIILPLMKPLRKYFHMAEK